MLAFLRKRIRTVSSFLLCIFFQFLATETFALTSGPSQEEFASFEPIGTTEMVDLYSGDFNYNIPLLSVPGPNGGYPINLAYHSGIGMDQEASWVGLGWNVNVGAINRSLRGLPDDFKGDVVEQKKHIRKSTSVGLDFFQSSGEFLGIPTGANGEFNPHNMQLQVYYNNYKGLGYRFKMQPVALASKDGGFSGGLGLSVDSQEGIGVDVSFSIGHQFANKKGTSGSFGLGVNGSLNSRQGLQFGFSGSVGAGSARNYTANVKYDKKSSYSWTESIGMDGHGSINYGASFSFNHGVPSASIPMKNVTYTMDLKLGFGVGPGAASGFTLGSGVPSPLTMQSQFPFHWTGMRSISEVKNDGVINSKAYGYIYTGDKESDKNLTDFSSAPVAFNRKLPFVTPSSVNHDIFSISGQGTGGVFRAHRGAIGIYSPQQSTSKNQTYPLNLEVGVNPQPIAPLFLVPPSCPVWYHAGFGTVPMGYSGTETGGWGASSGALNLTHAPTSSNTLLETSYMKMLGDIGAMTNTDGQYDTWKGEEPVRVSLAKSGAKFIATGIETNNSTAVSTTGEYNQKLKREVRSNAIQKLTNAEAQKYGMSKGIGYYESNGTTYTNKFPQGNHVEDHHISEIVHLQSDGTRYIYGLPAYNLSQEEATFSVNEGNSTQQNTKLIPVPNGPGYPVGASGFSRQDEFLDKTNLPAYVHSWMLTGVVSSDYVDLTGDGITDDDYGYWVKFEYKKVSDNYHWRAPYADASYSPGTEDDFDDRGSYTKGTKELYYLYKIQTKTHVAIFDISGRNDGRGALDVIAGGLSTALADQMQKLDQIRLYTIEEFENGGEDEPLKVVHFKYADNTTVAELCSGIRNRSGSGGKLTLEQVSFSYGRSTKGKLSPYKFYYSATNPSYSEVNYDCWGNYKNNQAYYAGYPYGQFPYTEQDPNHRTAVDAWHLNKIELPTGGAINVEYEEDDYAYVEDQKALQLFDIVALGDNFTTPMTTIPDRWGGTGSTTASLLNADNSNAPYRIYFKLKTPIPNNPNDQFYIDAGYTGALAREEWFRDHYIGNIEDIYFKAKVHLTPNGEDFVSAYATIQRNTAAVDFGVERSLTTMTTCDIGYITLAPAVITAGLGRIHPIRDRAFEHLRHVRSELIFGGTQAFDPASLFSFQQDIVNMLVGYKENFRMRGFAQTIYLDGQSVIRLQVPDGHKYGGGIRVKRLTISDNWDQMVGTTNGTNDTYGQVYDYTIEENGERISSGVAYEPYVGKEQSALVRPIKYKNSVPLQTAQNLFLETPLMMQHYPGASVGYRMITVKSITTESTGTAGNSTKRPTVPVSINEFYTPKDFPVIFKATNPDMKGPGYVPIPLPFYTQFYKRMAMSQGYSLILNNMAGKPKAMTATTKEGTLISKQEFEYFTKEENGKQVLDNEVQVFTGDKTYKKGRLGIEYDISVSMHEDKTVNYMVLGDFNLDGLPVGCLPIPTFIPNVTNMKTSLKTAVVQKIIQKQGILKSVTVTDGTSVIKTESLIFDDLTGEALLTKVTNEFKDEIYAYSQRARWFYDGMDAAFKNLGATIVSNGFTPGSPNATAPTYIGGLQWMQGLYYVPYSATAGSPSFPVEDWFAAGDEVWVESSEYPNGKRAFIMGLRTSSNGNQISLMYGNGTYVKAPHIDQLTVIRSGRRNLLGVNAGSIAAMGLDATPATILGDDIPKVLNFTPSTENPIRILNAAAVKFRDFWPNENCSSQQVCEDVRICVPGNGNISSVSVDGQVLDPWEYSIYGACSPTNSTVIQEVCVNTTGSYSVSVTDNGQTVSNFSYAPSGTTCAIPSNDLFTQIIPCNAEINWLEIVAGDYEVRVALNVDPNTLNPLTLTQTMMTATVLPSTTQSGLYVSNTGVDCDAPESGKVCYDNLVYALYCYSNSCNSEKVDIKWRNTVHGNYPSIGYKRISSANHRDKLEDIADWMDGVYPGNIDWYVGIPYGSTYNACPDGAPICADFPNLADANLFNGTMLSLQRVGSCSANTGCITGNCHENHPGKPNVNWGTGHFVYHNTDWNFEAEITPITNSGHQLQVNNLPPGTHSIFVVDATNSSNIVLVNLLSTSNSGSTVNVPVINVTLPQTTSAHNYTIKVYDEDKNPHVLVETVTRAVDGLATSTQIGLNLVGTGIHPVTVQMDGEPTFNFDAKCGANNAVTQPIACSGVDGNPYTKGTKGNWRPWMSFSYVTDRVYNDPNNLAASKGIRDEGHFADFVPFNWGTTNDDKWTSTSRVTKFSPYGFELENVDALGVYSGAQYDYNNNLLVAMGANARYQELAFDGFETYPRNCDNPFYFEGIDPLVDIVNTEHHTGKHSVAVTVNKSIESKKNVLVLYDDQACANALSGLGFTDVLNFLTKGEETASSAIPNFLRSFANTSDGLFEEIPRECTCLGSFAPMPSKEYYLSAWVKEGMPSPNNVVSYDASAVRVIFLDGADQEIGFVDVMPSGKIIEGWQRMESKFTVPSGTYAIKVSLRHLPTNAYISYFDDLRIHPAEAGMQSYVYNPQDYRIMAELDNNNYATFYIYDEEGNLIKVKKETEEGIKTIKEGRRHTVDRKNITTQ